MDTKEGLPLHRKFFWSIAFFLLGVFFSSIIVDWSSRLLASFLFSILLALFFFFVGKKTFAILVLFSILGSSFFIWDDTRYRLSNHLGNTFAGKAKVVGLVERDNYIQADLNTGQGTIRAYLSPGKRVKYGDLLYFEAGLKEFSQESRRYFEKEGVHALASYPKLEILEQGMGLKRVLYGFRDQLAFVFTRYLDGERATFMTGITLGRSSGFSAELSEKLSATGTTHLVALSGYNITVIAAGIGFLLSFLLSRRVSFYGSVLAIFVFVLMTGGEASVVRAGIMGSLILLANYIGEIYSLRNAIAFTALVMILFNPKILAFDLGFQLSFLALIGIVYLRPILERRLGLSGYSFLAWKENLSMTLSAQLMVLPLILFSFSFMPAFSLLTNVLILTFIPLTMFFGFLIVISSVVSSFLASFFAFLANILLGYELAVIDLFSKFPIGIRVDNFSFLLLLIIYTLAFIFIYNKRDAKA